MNLSPGWTTGRGTPEEAGDLWHLRLELKQKSFSSMRTCPVTEKCTNEFYLWVVDITRQGRVRYLVESYTWERALAMVEIIMSMFTNKFTKGRTGLLGSFLQLTLKIKEYLVIFTWKLESWLTGQLLTLGNGRLRRGEGHLNLSDNA